MFNRCLQRFAALALITLAGPALAAVVTLSGSLADAANADLVASDLMPAQFVDEQALANNVALYALHVAVGGNVNFSSTGFAPGGIDPYFTLFSGTDRATASFLDSNYVQAFGGGGDFTQDVMLAAGDYTVAIDVFANMSLAENGGGFLADGFTGLGGAMYFGDGSYRFAVTLPDGVGHVVTQIAGYVDTANGTLPNSFLHSSLGGSGYSTLPFTGTRGPNTPLGTRIFINHSVLAHFGAGENPRGAYQVFSDTMSGGALLMLTGYYVNVP